MYARKVAMMLAVMFSLSLLFGTLAYADNSQSDGNYYKELAAIRLVKAKESFNSLKGLLKKVEKLDKMSQKDHESHLELTQTFHDTTKLMLEAKNKALAEFKKEDNQEMISLLKEMTEQVHEVMKEHLELLKSLKEEK